MLITTFFSLHSFRLFLFLLISFVFISVRVAVCSAPSIRFVLQPHIFHDGLGDAALTFRVLEILKQSYPRAIFEILAYDYHHDRLGERFLEELLSNYGDVSARFARNELQFLEMCEREKRKKNTIYILLPYNPRINEFRDRTHVITDELGTGQYAFGFIPGTLGLPLPENIEDLVETTEFHDNRLKKLFLTSTSTATDTTFPIYNDAYDDKPFFSYAKFDSAFVSSLWDLFRAINARNGKSHVDIINIGYTLHQFEGHQEEFCGNEDVGYIWVLDNVEIYLCNPTAPFQIRIHSFQRLKHSDFLKALALSHPIVGVTGDQSFLETFSLGKIPLGDCKKDQVRTYFVEMLEFVAPVSVLLQFMKKFIDYSCREWIEESEFPIENYDVSVMHDEMNNIVLPFARDHLNSKRILKERIDRLLPIEGRMKRAIILLFGKQWQRKFAKYRYNLRLWFSRRRAFFSSEYQ